MTRHTKGMRPSALTTRATPAFFPPAPQILGGAAQVTPLPQWERLLPT